MVKRVGVIKKLLSVLLVVTFVISLFSSCGSENQRNIEDELLDAEFITMSAECIFDLGIESLKFPIDLDEFNRCYDEVVEYTERVKEILIDFENNNNEILSKAYDYEYIPAYSQACADFFNLIDTYVRPAAEKGTSISVSYGKEKCEEIESEIDKFFNHNWNCYDEIYTLLCHETRLKHTEEFSLNYVATDDYILTFSARGRENDLTEEAITDILVEQNLNNFDENRSVNLDINCFVITLNDKIKTEIEIYVVDIRYYDDEGEIQKDTYYFKFETDECTETLSIAGYLNQESNQVVILQPYEKLIVSNNNGSVANTQTQENMVVLENYDSIYKYYGYIREDDADFSNQYLELENPMTVHSQYDDRVYENVRKIYFFEEDFPTYKVDEFAEVSGVIFDYRDGGEFYFENPEIK